MVMINDLKKEIEYATSKYYYFHHKINTFIAYLIQLKYLCDTNVYSYEEVLLNDDLYELNCDIVRIKKYFKDDKILINRILLSIKNVDTKELLLEFLDSIDKPLCLHEGNNVAYLNVENELFRFYSNKGNVTYVMKSPEFFEIAKVFDKILNINNNYVLVDDFVKEDFDYIYIYDGSLRFSIYSEDVLDEIKKLLGSNNIILIANYNKISNFREGRFLTGYIKTIVLDNKKAYIVFQKPREDDQVTIISTDKIKDKTKLPSIIKNNRKQKDVLIKIRTQDLRENNYRIGFNLYKLEKTNIIKDINKIVDENTMYLERLNIINMTVQREINKLLNR